MKVKLFLAGLFLSVFITGAAFAEAEFHIGIVTGTVSQSEDDLRGAELMIQKYGNAAEGGMVTHLTQQLWQSSENALLRAKQSLRA